MSDATFAKIEKIARSVFTKHSGAIQPTSSAKDIIGWDSLAHINFVLALEEEFNVPLRPAQLAHMANLDEIATHIDGKM